MIYYNASRTHENCDYAIMGHDRAYFVNDQSKSEVLGHGDCTLLKPCFDLCSSSVHVMSCDQYYRNDVVSNFISSLSFTSREHTKLE